MDKMVFVYEQVLMQIIGLDLQKRYVIALKNIFKPDLNIQEPELSNIESLELRQVEEKPMDNT